ncbi:anthranilate synthase component II [Magnetospirillum molischianum]|uniref:Anthranilate synthase component 2 n=1 Tax=Magnetospirillum molischianum DSM 120 TaxID=1150626 RepID=H8FNF0_MAGML|nr:aminodeoxychorismate/anthranilate synthase component II [Magnetospirillum molischianum]CCG39888.1 Anthranilate synthase component 2 [Magnetospirillum molischianum DSM 120]
MFLLIDNYDSFTYNLWHYLGELGADVEVRRNDVLTVEQALALQPQGIVISPGPCDPDRAGICLDLIAAAAARRVPLFGVCLGHQSIGQAFGGKVIRAPQALHGKISAVSHDGSGVFAGLPSPFRATRYHSLVVERETFPDSLHISAWTDDGLVMGLAHRELPVWGVQFHPESIETEHGHQMIRNFLDFSTGSPAHALVNGAAA